MSWIKTAQRVDFLDGDLRVTRSRGVDRSRAGQSCTKDLPCSSDGIQAKLNESTEQTTWWLRKTYVQYLRR